MLQISGFSFIQFVKEDWNSSGRSVRETTRGDDDEEFPVHSMHLPRTPAWARWTGQAYSQASNHRGKLDSIARLFTGRHRLQQFNETTGPWG